MDEIRWTPLLVGACALAFSVGRSLGRLLVVEYRSFVTAAFDFVADHVAAVLVLQLVAGVTAVWLGVRGRRRDGTS